MAKFFNKVLMTSESVQSKVRSGLFLDSAANADIYDGAFVVMGDHVADKTYANTGDINYNAYILTAPAAATDTVAVVDIAGVATAKNDDLVYKIGVRQFGLTAEAGELVRVRVLDIGDMFELGSGNFNGTPTVGQYAILENDKTTLKPNATVPGSGFTVKILKKSSFEPGQRVVADSFRYLVEVVQL